MRYYCSTGLPYLYPLRRAVRPWVRGRFRYFRPFCGGCTLSASAEKRSSVVESKSVRKLKRMELFSRHIRPLIPGARATVLEYIVMHTVVFDDKDGHPKACDCIELDQFCEGIKKKDGTGWFDHGTGLGRSTVIEALERHQRKRNKGTGVPGLLELRLGLTRYNQTSRRNGDEPSAFRLEWNQLVSWAAEEWKQRGYPIAAGVLDDPDLWDDEGSSKNWTPPPVQKLDPQLLPVLRRVKRCHFAIYLA